MPSQKVTLYLRANRLPNRPFLQPTTRRGEVKPFKAVYQGEDITLEAGTFEYYIRYAEGAKRVFKPVGADLRDAIKAKVKAQASLDAQAAGVEVVGPVAPVKGPTVKAEVEKYINYLISLGRADSTVYNFRLALGHLENYLDPKKVGATKPLAALTKEDLLGFAQAQRERVKVVNGVALRQVSESTIRLFIRQISSFLISRGIHLLPRKEWPTFTEPVPDFYSRETIHTLLPHLKTEHRIAVRLLLATGLRKGEGCNLPWAHIDLATGLLTIQEVSDQATGETWDPKTRSGRSVRLTSDLLSLLRARRLERPKDEYVLGAGDKPLAHLLKPVKMAAFRAGLNCGCCTTKAGHRCADGPFCKKVTLQKLRRTFINLSDQSGVTINEIRTTVGHRSPDTIMRYLAAANLQTPELLGKLDAAFGSFAT
jgi:integrase